jgi:hypothetical protein
MDSQPDAQGLIVRCAIRQPSFAEAIRSRLRGSNCPPRVFTTSVEFFDSPVPQKRQDIELTPAVRPIRL